MNPAERFVDANVIEPNARRILCLDARAGWARMPLNAKADMVIVTGMRDADTIRTKLRDAGFAYQVERDTTLCASVDAQNHRPCADSRVLCVGDVAVLAFDAPPPWGAVAACVRGSRLVVGSFGFDAAEKPGLCTIVARVLQMQPVPGLHAYADADFADASVSAPWALLRCVWDYAPGEGGLPLMGAGVLRARDSDALLGALRDVARNAAAVDVVRLVRKRNHDSDNQPQWDTVKDRCPAALWQRLQALQVVRRVRDVLIATPRAKLVLLLAQG